jgi:peptidylprolyl isomerase
MRARYFLAFAALCAAAAACENDPVGPQCEEISSTVARTNGDTVTTTTGLRYLEVRAGTGATVAACTDVGIHYTLFLNGTAVDSLRTPGQEFPFLPGAQPPEVIRGVEEGVLGMRVGGRRRLIIPPALGYGATAQIDRRTGAVVIPANSTLVFDVEVVSFD